MTLNIIFSVAIKWEYVVQIYVLFLVYGEAQFGPLKMLKGWAYFNQPSKICDLLTYFFPVFSFLLSSFQPWSDRLKVHSTYIHHHSKCIQWKLYSMGVTKSYEEDRCYRYTDSRFRFMTLWWDVKPRAMARNYIWPNIYSSSYPLYSSHDCNRSRSGNLPLSSLCFQIQTTKEVCKTFNGLISHAMLVLPFIR